MKIKNIVLIGFMGSGKSFVSNKLGAVLNRPVISTDKWIEKRAERTIPEIFQDSGEAYFRRLERQAIEEIALKEGIVIDCGGGVVLNQRNLEDLKKTGILFYLEASADFLFKNIQRGEHRPLMDVSDPLSKIKELLKIREPFYQQADYLIDADYKTIDEITASILKVIIDERN